MLCAKKIQKTLLQMTDPMACLWRLCLGKTGAISEAPVWVRDRMGGSFQSYFIACWIFLDVSFLNCIVLELVKLLNQKYPSQETSERMSEIQLRRMDGIESWRQKVNFFAIYFLYLNRNSGFRPLENRSNWSSDHEDLWPHTNCCQGWTAWWGYFPIFFLSLNLINNWNVWRK